MGLRITAVVALLGFVILLGALMLVVDLRASAVVASLGFVICLGASILVVLGVLAFGLKPG